MRLRYLHLPRYGPLTDTGVAFGREDLIAQTLNLPRKGSLNFVVGVNGSGKSSLLRALYRIFRELKNKKFPPMPFTVAWDILLHRASETAILHVPSQKNEKPWFAVLPQEPSNLGKANWEHLVNQLNEEQNNLGFEETTKRGDDVLGSFLQAYLPKRLIAYTSGTDDPWVQLDQRVFHPRDEEEGQYQTEDERPQGWSMDQEWEEIREHRETAESFSNGLKPDPDASFGFIRIGRMAGPRNVGNLAGLGVLGEDPQKGFHSSRAQK